jgi:site-specific DNA-methyltransferase (adenine-specific)
MKPESFLDGKAILYCGDCLDVMKDLAENTFDSVVTDPPYALVSISKRFGKDGAAPCKTYEGKSGAYKRACRGFMGKQWDTGDTAHAVEFWRECLRVLKPGGHVLAFAGTRTYHRLACAIEDAGFEIRDMVQWLYGSGFPKSHDVSKGIDKAAGARRHVISEGAAVKRMIPGADQNKDGWIKDNGREYIPTVTAAATLESAQWTGWGTALKPACEPICMARKPLSEKTVAANVLRWGTGAINIDASRVPASGENFQRPAVYNGTHQGWKRPWMSDPDALARNQVAKDQAAAKAGDLGRWPANVLIDSSEEVAAMFPESGPSSDSPRNNAAFKSVAKGYDKPHTTYGHEDSGGSAARFFWSSKAGSDDRLGSKHPTVKPIDLMQYLVRLVTPPGGLVLDPFAGTGVTAEACYREGMRCTMVERETEYQSDIRRRMALVLAGPDERQRESIKAKGLPVDNGPLFAAE